METSIDAQLVKRSQEGDRRAFEQLARSRQGPLLAFLRRMLGDEDDARDVCQETLLRAYLGIRALREPDRVDAWLHRIAVNQCRDRHRRAASRPLRAVCLDEPEASEVPSPEAGPEELAEQGDRARAVRAALARLSEDQRTAIVLREYQGFTSAEIATITGVPAATVRSRIFYGLRALARILREEWQGETS